MHFNSHQQWILCKMNKCSKTLDFLGRSAGKESAFSAGDWGSIAGLGRSPGGGHGNPLQCSCMENPYEQRSQTGYSPWGCEELDTTEQASIAQHSKSLLLFSVSHALN